MSEIAIFAESACIESNLNSDLEITIYGVANIKHLLEYKEPAVYEKTQSGEIKVFLKFTKDDTAAITKGDPRSNLCALQNENHNGEIKSTATFFYKLSQTQIEKIAAVVEKCNAQSNLIFKFIVQDKLTEKSYVEDDQNFDEVTFQIDFDKYLMSKNFNI